MKNRISIIINKMNHVPLGLWKKVSSNKSSSQASLCLDSRKYQLSPKSTPCDTIKCDTIKQTKKQSELAVSDYLISISKYSPVIEQQQGRKCSLSYQFQQSVQITSLLTSNNQLEQKSKAKSNQRQSQLRFVQQQDLKNTQKKQTYQMNVYQSFGINLNSTPHQINSQTLKKRYNLSLKSALQSALCQIRNLRNYCFQISDLFFDLKQNIQNQLLNAKQQIEKKFNIQDQSSKVQLLNNQIELLQKQNDQIWSKYEDALKQKQKFKRICISSQQQKFKQQQIKYRKVNIELQQKYNVLLQQNQILNRQKNAINTQMNLLNQKISRLDSELQQKTHFEKENSQRYLQMQGNYFELLKRVKDLQQEVERKQVQTQQVQTPQYNYDQFNQDFKSKFQFNPKLALLRMQQSYQIVHPEQKISLNRTYNHEREKQFANLRHRATVRNDPNSFIQQRITKRKLQSDRSHAVFPLTNQKIVRPSQRLGELFMKNRSSSQSQKTFFCKKNLNFSKSQFRLNSQSFYTNKLNSINFQNSAKQKIRYLHANIDKLTSNLKAQIKNLK